MILRLGSTGPDVVAWQRLIGLPAKSQTGYFGTITDAATREWQKARGLKVDGIVGPQTFAAAVGAPARVEGVDVSGAQSQIDFEQVREQQKLFAFVRANAGEAKRDASFLAQAEGFAAVDVLVGAYQYALVDGDASDDVDAFVYAIEPAAHRLLLPPVIDIESLNGVEAERAVAWLVQWATRCRQLLGVRPLIYTGPYFWRSVLKAEGASFFANHPLFISHYGAASPSVPAPWSRWAFWQYAANTIWLLPDGSHAWGWKRPHPDAIVIAHPGIVPGITGEVDCDVFNGTLDELKGLRALLSA